MKLSKLLEKLEYEVLNGNVDIDIKNLVYDSRKAGALDVFVCVTGAVSDGHTYISDVAGKGVLAIVVQKDIEVTEELKDITLIKTADTRYALALMSAAFFDYPAKKLKTIGITGTKGKTTTTFMIRDILGKCNIKAGLIGTNETIIGDVHIPSKNTTPESFLIQKYFSQMVEAGCSCVVMEVSSQALMLNRTAGILFDIGVFTNIEPDHIGPNEHASFEEYMECKSRLFKQCVHGIGNADSEYFDKIMEGHTCTLETYGIKNKADLKVENIRYIHEGGNITTSYNTTGTRELNIKLTLPGEFSVYNSLCAIAVSEHFNVDDKLLLDALYNTRVAGRVEPVKVSDDFIVMIDYAHNAMSLESLLSTLREYNPNRIVCLFGCGGNRSKLRRFEMGEVSGRMADLTIITSDNPRDEDPALIMQDIETGIKKTSGSYVMIEDRGEAVKYAIEHGEKGDIIVLAGKGHEDYQEIKGVRYHQTDKELVQKAMEDLAR